MRNIITPDMLRTMIPQEYRDQRGDGGDLRRESTRAVMRDPDCPTHWGLNDEYRSESGGFLPVQIRFTPPHGNFNLAMCSPSDINPPWMMAFIPASGRSFSVICTLSAWSPEVISHMLNLVARLDADGYSQTSIISVLAMGGTL